MSNLLTHHDPLHIHAILGMLSLIHYTYRVIMFAFYHTMGFDHSIYSFISISIHILLSISSLFFHVPSKRQQIGKPMIWSEYRLHSVLFALRPLLSLLVVAVFPRHMSIVINSSLVILTMAFADLASNYFQSKERTKLSMIECFVNFRDSTPSHSSAQPALH